MEKLNAGIIGCGSIYSVHADAILDCGKARLAAVCDINEQRLSSAVARYECRGYMDYRELLRNEDIDVIHICTPHYLHASMAVEAMKSGKHVLVEKPMAINTKEAEKMIEVSRETSRKLGVCFQNRYNPTSVKIKEMIDSKITGEIKGAKAFVTWHRTKEYYTESGWRGTWEKEGGGVLINQSIHTLDLLQWFLGEADSLKAHVDTRLLYEFIEVEDTADALIRFKNGANAIFYVTNCYSDNSPVQLEIHCENAVLKLDGDLIIKHKNGDIERVPESGISTDKPAYWGNSHKKLINEFYDSIIQDKPFAVDGVQGISTLRYIEAIYESSKCGKYIKL